MELIQIKNIKPAEYNPRFLSEEAKEELKKSLTQLGCVKPIVVNGDNMTIIAGHQRTKTMEEIGITECPAFIINGINIADEIRFNQYHNKCEYEINQDAPIVRVTAKLKVGEFTRVESSEIEIIDKGKLAVYNTQLCYLLTQYGEFGAPICDTDGNVVISSAYAYASKICNKGMYVYTLSGEKMKLAVNFFSKNYGVFNYDNITKNTYVQRFAQMKRLRDGKKGVGNSMRSTLYERLVIPFLDSLDKNNLSILDFGAGRFDYARKLQREGYNVDMLDPYHTINNSDRIDFFGNVIRFRKLIERVQEGKRYDVVICDSVLNSVDSAEAELSVILCCKFFAKLGGIIFISGRRLEFEEQRERQKSVRKSKISSMLNMRDERGFTGIYRNGEWYYQKFHGKEQRENILNILGEGEVFMFHDRKSNFCIKAKKTQEHESAETLKALQFEFNLPLPNGKRYGLHK